VGHHELVGALEAPPQLPPSLCLEVAIEIFVEWAVPVARHDARFGVDRCGARVPWHEPHALEQRTTFTVLFVAEAIGLGLDACAHAYAIILQRDRGVAGHSFDGSACRGTCVTFAPFVYVDDDHAF